MASFKRQQEQSFQEQSSLAAEARETRRQELLEKIAEGQAAKKQKLEQDSGADEGQEAGGSEAPQGSTPGGETTDDGQANGQQEEAGEGKAWGWDLGQEGRNLWLFLGISRPCLVGSVKSFLPLPQALHLPQSLLLLQSLHLPSQGLQTG